ncbi:MAG: hypothetical protein ACE1ZN_05915 [Dehalococcoidia bacterium]
MRTPMLRSESLPTGRQAYRREVAEMERIRVRTRSAQCLEDVTEQVAEAVRRSGVEEGVCHLFVPTPRRAW